MFYRMLRSRDGKSHMTCCQVSRAQEQVSLSHCLDSSHNWLPLTYLIPPTHARIRLRGVTSLDTTSLTELTSTFDSLRGLRRLYVRP